MKKVNSLITDIDFSIGFDSEEENDEAEKDRLEAEAQAAAEAESKRLEEEKAKLEAEKAKNKSKSTDDDDFEAKLKAIEDEKAKLLKESMKRKEAMQEKDKVLAEREKELEKIKAAMGSIDLDQLKEIVKQNEEAERKAAEARGEYDQIVSQLKEREKSLTEKYETEVQTAQQKLAALASKVENLTVGRAFSDSTFIKESSTLPASIARQTFGEYFDADENGNLVAYTLPRGQEGRVPLVDADGNHKSFEAAISELYNKHPDAKSLIRSKQKPGASSGTEDRPSASQFDKSGQPAKEVGPRGIDRIKSVLAGAN